MNKDDVIRMAKESGLVLTGDTQDGYIRDGKYGPQLERFFQDAYAAGAAAEREACAYRAGIAMLGADRGLANRVDQAIRARGDT